ncbi:hypothetical protein ACFWQC_02030 [Nocardioides sp. NPDC058538]|uniref:hypothetical protein n=1 Tax=Nocardioides sp. NPDC058538 TaxID=3346542 RepID=UPI003649F6E8
MTEPMPPPHVAVEQEDVERLRDLLDAGGDVHEEWNGMSLLAHAVDTEADGAAQAGDPLHVDTTAYLLSRGADPTRRGQGGGGSTAVEDAQASGHWLASALFAEWTRLRGNNAATSARPVVPLMSLDYRLLRSAWGIAISVKGKAVARAGARRVRKVDGRPLWLEFAGAAAELPASSRDLLLVGLSRVAPEIALPTESVTVVVDDVAYADTDFQAEFLEIAMCRWAERAFGVQPRGAEEWFDADAQRYRFSWT